jgi:hypothetical protein
VENPSVVRPAVLDLGENLGAKVREEKKAEMGKTVAKAHKDALAHEDRLENVENPSVVPQAVQDLGENLGARVQLDLEEKLELLAAQVAQAREVLRGRPDVEVLPGQRDAKAVMVVMESAVLQGRLDAEDLRDLQAATGNEALRVKTAKMDVQSWNT